MDRQPPRSAYARMPARQGPPQYTVAEFARRHGLSAVRAKEILDMAGDSREAADLHAERRRPQEINTWTPRQ